MTAGPAAIAFDQVTRRYGTVTAIDRLSFEVARGEMFGLIGPDGAGKTTTIRVAGGLLRPDGGRVSVLGKDHGIGSIITGAIKSALEQASGGGKS